MGEFSNKDVVEVGNAEHFEAFLANAPKFIHELSALREFGIEHECA